MVGINAFFIETHAHLDLIKRNAHEVLRDALENRVEKIITIGVDLPTSEIAVEYTSHFTAVYASIGYHPHESKHLDEFKLKELEKIAQNPKVIAIGETGLDYYWKHSPLDVQAEVFKKQINLARKLGLPLIVHNREAHQDTLKILAEEARGLKILLHCFSGDVNIARECIRLNYYLGIGGVITFSNAKKLRAVVEEIPLENLMLETDSPYLTPHPFRGKPNEPKYIPFIAEKIAELKGIEVEEVARVTSNTAQKFFKI